jgi:TRAP transporter TAXI family solute receptor
MLAKFKLLVAAVVGLTGLAVTGAEAQRITIGTNPQGSGYYVVGGGIAALMTERLGRQAIVQPYAGSSVYLPLISSGEATLGFSSSLDSGRAYRGEEGSKPLANLRALARLYPLPYAYMARAADGLKTVADLAGKQVVVDIRANAALAEANRAILAAAGLEESDYEAVTIGNLPQGAQDLVDGSVDAHSVAVGVPFTQEAHAALSGGIIYLAITGENATSEFLDSMVPGLFMMDVEPADNRPGVVGTTPVSGFDVFLVTSTEVSDEDAYEMIRVLHEGYDQLMQDYPQAREGATDLLSRATNTVPYHPGSIAYFKEQGMWTEENERREHGFDN